MQEEGGCEPNLVTYNVMLDLYSKKGKPYGKSKSLVNKMKERGVAPDTLIILLQVQYGGRSERRLSKIASPGRNHRCEYT